ncbi:hypothetical protein PF006_g29559 [Phytophthora fragariae]|uniref:DUF6570 domain-containing protein n=1 Tax=Phytophthora fragariae TaxID=53985 RepID=A0A6A3Q694_9STRA|nr:hypothetical protein PF006_g29559 [Phytophthora fragariae]
MPRPKQPPDDIRMIRSCPAYMILLQEREALRRATPGSAAIDESPASRRILSLPECIAPTPAFATTTVAVQLDDATTSTEQSPIFPIEQSSSVSPHRERVPMDHVCNGSMHTKAELLQMDVDQDFLVPSAERLAVIQQEAIDAMLEASSGPRPCCVCELDWPEKDILCQDLTAKLVKDMKRCLIVALPPEFPEFIIKHYDASTMDVRLKGLMLLPLAVFKEHGVVKVNICKRCNNHISRNVSTPPSAAIANGNYIGHLPTPFQTMTRTDEQAISLVLPSVSLSVVTRGLCRTIKSHHYIVRNTEGPIVEMLPRDLSHRVRVTMTPTIESIAVVNTVQMTHTQT